MRKIQQAVRGDINTKVLVAELARRAFSSFQRVGERALVSPPTSEPPRLAGDFGRMSGKQLLEDFRSRETPVSLPGLNSSTKTIADLHSSFFPEETEELVSNARRICDRHEWKLLGFGTKNFRSEINWNLDPLSAIQWPQLYHRDISLFRGDGSDARVIWELNRLGHLVTLGQAFAVTGDERFAEEFFGEIRSWNEQNPVGLTINWACAMEVALRAVNVLVCLQLFRSSTHLGEGELIMLLKMFDQHGAHIRRNLEFSYISTSNHYLSDVVGLLWLGIMLPELEESRKWREFGLREVLREMDKQVLNDGADYEASTGYHRFVTEMFLYTFILCRENQIEIGQRYWDKLEGMLEYLNAYIRPDGLAPLIGDTDSGQFLPWVPRRGDEHSYLLPIGAVVFNRPRFKHSAWRLLEELLWVMGEAGVQQYQELPEPESEATSVGFPDAGTYIQREKDLYLLFNASGNGLLGRGSHGHNDALSIEVFACGSPFIVDPGTYVYSSDLTARHEFRSTAYHSTVEIDGVEQNSTDINSPFVLGNEGHPRVLEWETSSQRDLVTAEHSGYFRLADPALHRRTVTFDKAHRFWIVADSLSGRGEHVACFRFHMAPELDITAREDGVIQAFDQTTGARLLFAALDIDEPAELEPNFSSTDYGQEKASLSICWRICFRAPLLARWALVPLCSGDNEVERLMLIENLRRNPQAMTVVPD